MIGKETTIVLKDEAAYVGLQRAAELLGMNQRAVRNLVSRRRLEADREGEGAAARLLAEAAVEKLGTIVAELDEYIRKHDYRFQDETLAGAEAVPRRAIERAVGRAEPE